MKGISYRVFALAALLAVLASFLPLSGRLGPVGPQTASAGNLSWEALTTLPGATGNVVPNVPSVMSKVVASSNFANDKTLFGINRTVVPVAGVFTAATNAIWKSTDGGATWTSRAFGTGLAAASTIVDIAISQNYGTDMTVAVAVDDPAAGVNASTVWRTNDGGSSWQQLPGLVLAAADQLTGIAIGIDINGAAVYAVSVANTAAATFPVPAGTVAPVLAFGVNGFLGWSNFGTVASTPLVDASAVAFSSNFQSDRTIVFVGSTAAATALFHVVVVAAAPGAPGAYLSLGVATPVSGVITGMGDGATAIVRSHLAIPGDFNATATARRTAFVATNSGTVANDNVFRATLASATAAVNMGLTVGAVEGLGLSGTIASGTGTLVAGAGGANAGGLLGTTTAPFSAAPTWTQNTVVNGDTAAGAGAPPGLMTYAAIAPGNRVFAATYLAGMLDAGLSVSDDGGTNFRQISNLGTALTTICSGPATPAAAAVVCAGAPAGGATWRAYTLSANFANDNTVFAYSTDAIVAGYDSLWRSTDGGATWARVFAFMSTGNTVSLTSSPGYATDGTLYFRDTGGNRFYVSRDRGTSWSLATTLPVAAWGTLLFLDANTMLAGLTNGNIYRATYNATTQSWTWGSTAYSTFSPTPAAAVAPVNISRRGTTNDMAVAVGGASGEVYLSSDLGVTLTRLGTTPANGVAGAFPVVAFGPGYATDSYVYANAAVAVGGAANAVARWKVGTSTTWEPVCGIAAVTLDTLACGTTGGLMLAFSATFAYFVDGFAYAAGPGAGAAGGLWSTSNLGDLNTTVRWSQLRAGTGGTELAAGTTVGYLAVRTLPNNAGRQFFLRNAAAGPDTIVTYTDTSSNLAPSTPTLVSPAANAFGMGGADPANLTLVLGSSILLNWNPVAGATSYRVQLSTDPNFSAAAQCGTTLAAGAPPITTTNMGALCGVPGLAEAVVGGVQDRVAGQAYHWRVRVETPNVSPWSEGRSFTTALVAPVGVGAPVPIQPNVASASVDPSVRNQVPTSGTLFVWTAVAGATFYELQVSTDATFLDASKLAINATGALALGNQLAFVSTVPLTGGTTYFWRVRGVTVATVGAWSPATAFTTVGTSAPLTVAEATATIQGAYDIVWVFDNATQSWKSYTPGAPAFANTLANLTPGTPVWIKANRAAVWTRGANSVNLVQGWNLVVAP